MTLNIHWVDDLPQEIESRTIVFTVAKLAVFQKGNVITKSKWLLDDDVTAESADRLHGEFYQYFNESNFVLEINLLKQGSVFRNKVWMEIANIPSGEVLTYSQLAFRLGSGARAVANACRDNPFPGIIPCHRVVAVSDLGGYMGETKGQFLDIKRALLDIEKQ